MSMLERGVGKGEEGARSRRLAVSEAMQWNKLGWSALVEPAKERWSRFTPSTVPHIWLAGLAQRNDSMLSNDWMSDTMLAGRDKGVADSGPS